MLLVNRFIHTFKDHPILFCIGLVSLSVMFTSAVVVSVPLLIVLLLIILPSIVFYFLASVFLHFESQLSLASLPAPSVENYIALHKVKETPSKKSKNSAKDYYVLNCILGAKGPYAIFVQLCLQMLKERNNCKRRFIKALVGALNALRLTPEYLEAIRIFQKTGDPSACEELEKQIFVHNNAVVAWMRYVAINDFNSIVTGKKQYEKEGKPRLLNSGLLTSDNMDTAICECLQAVRTYLPVIRRGGKLKAQKIISSCIDSKPLHTGTVFKGKNNCQGVRVDYHEQYGWRLLLPVNIGKEIFSLKDDKTPKYNTTGFMRDGNKTYWLPLELPKNEYWGKFNAVKDSKDPKSAADELLKDLCYIQLNCSIDVSCRRRIRVNFVYEGLPDKTPGAVKGLQEGGFDPDSDSSMVVYKQTVVGVDQGTASICCYTHNKLQMFSVFPDYRKFSNEVKKYQRKLESRDRQLNPHKLNKDGTWKCKKEDPSPRIRDRRTEEILIKLRAANERLVKARRVDQRRIANVIAGLGGILNLEYMKWRNYTGFPSKNDRSSSKKGSKEVNSESNNLKEHATANSMAVDGQKKVNIASPDQKGTEVASAESSLKGTVNSSKNTSVQVAKANKKQNSSKKPKKKSKRRYGRRRHRAPAQQQSFLKWRVHCNGGVCNDIPTSLGGTNHIFPWKYNKEFRDLCGPIGIDCNYVQVIYNNKGYMIQRDAYASLMMYCVDYVEATVETKGKKKGKKKEPQVVIKPIIVADKILQEFETFLAEHDRVRAIYVAEDIEYQHNRAERNAQGKGKKVGYKHPILRDDINAPSYEVFSKWRITKTDQKRLDRFVEFCKGKGVTPCVP